MEKLKSAITKLLVIALPALTITAISGFSTASNAAACTFKPKSPITVGYSVFDMKQPYFQIYAAGIKSEAKKLGWAYVESDQKSSEQLQVSGSSDLINQGISALIVSPIQPSALPATITQAHASNIPVIIGDVGAVGDYDAYVVSNNYNGGVLAGEYMVKALAKVKGTKEIAVSSLDPSISVGVDRVNGFLSVIKKHKDFKVVTNLNGNNTTPGGLAVVKAALTAHPNIAGVFTANDPMGAGAAQAIAQAKKTGKIVLVSFNGDPFALDMVNAGTINATIAQDPYGQGVSAVDAAAALLKCDVPAFTKPATKTIEANVDVITKANASALKAKNAAITG